MSADFRRGYIRGRTDGFVSGFRAGFLSCGAAAILAGTGVFLFHIFAG